MPTQSELFGDQGDRCKVAVSNNYDSCGTITRSNIAYATPSGLLSIFKSGSASTDHYRDMQSLMTTNMELKACGTKTYGLYDWLMSSARPVGSLVNQKKIQGTDSIMEPFILASQKSIINDDFWAVIKGWTISEYQTARDGGGNDAAAATYPLTDTQSAGVTYGIGNAAGSSTAATRVLRLVNRYGLDGAANWFVKGGTIHTFGRKATGEATRTQWVIVAAEPKADGSYTDVAVSSMTGGTATDGNVDATINSGVAVIGANNVSDYESWCENRPALNPNKVVPFWTQTSRYTLCVDEFYKEWFAKLTSNNPYFAKFGDVTIAERNRQLGGMWQKEWMNSFFWGKRIGANQTLANWTSLGPQYAHYSSTLGGVSTTDGKTTGTLVSRKANAIGVYEQLFACGRVKDLKGQKLNLAELFNEIYTLYRTRSNSGRPSDNIDVYTDSKTASLIQRAMVKYYGAATSTGSNSAISFDYQVKDGKIDKLGFRVRSYELLYPQGVTLNIITDHYFDDFATAANVEQTIAGQHADAAANHINTTGRFLMILDLGGGIYPGIVDSNRKVHTVGALEDLAKVDSGYGCVMRSPTKEVTLNSVTWTAIVECPDDNLIVENFTAEEPTVVESTAVYQIEGGSDVAASTTDLLDDSDLDD